MTNRQSDTKTTKQTRVDVCLHKLLKLESARAGISIKELLDMIVSDWVSANNIHE